jgi:hypothetical protein
MTTVVTTHEVGHPAAPETQFTFDGVPGEQFTITHAGGEAFNEEYVGVDYDTADGLPRRERWSNDADASQRIIREGGAHVTDDPVGDGTTIEIVAVSGPDGQESTIGSYEVAES